MKELNIHVTNLNLQVYGIKFANGWYLSHGSQTTQDYRKAWFTQNLYHAYWYYSYKVGKGLKLDNVIPVFILDENTGKLIKKEGEIKL